MTNHAISIDGLVQASEALRRLVKREEVEARRERAVQGEREEMRRASEARAASKGGKKLDVGGGEAVVAVVAGVEGGGETSGESEAVAGGGEVSSASAPAAQGEGESETA